MTIKELYEWAQDVGVANAEIELQHQDGGRAYESTCEMSEISCKKDEAGNIIAVVLA